MIALLQLLVVSMAAAWAVVANILDTGELAVAVLAAAAPGGEDQ